jgi:O-phosphoseryl-tRNA(Cys) synthetase
LFGKERDQIGKLEGDIKRNVDVAAEVRWEIEFDKKALEEQTAALEQAIRDGLKEQIDKNSEAVTKALAGEVAGINVRVDSLEQRVNNGAGARN